jgi:predicted choloylglycine hydrolase
MTHMLTFDAVREARPGPKWLARWDRSWPAYEVWFTANNGDSGPSRTACETALKRHMPELVSVHAELTRLAGGSDRAARFLSTWCPPAYLGGCSLAAHADAGEVRLLRNYDLSPDLNEGLLLHSTWCSMPVMGMVEFLWGLSDGINAAGLSVALAFGGSGTVRKGFGVTTILRYVLETCTDVPQALAVLERVPSHMAYNIVLADRHANTASVELIAGGGMRRRTGALATNHQHGTEKPDRPGFTRTHERHSHLETLLAGNIAPDALSPAFLKEPLHQQNYANGFGTLFTAEYAPLTGGMTLHWPQENWQQSLDSFTEGSRTIRYTHQGPVGQEDPLAALGRIRPFLPPSGASRLDLWLNEASKGRIDWARFGTLFTR